MPVLALNTNPINTTTNALEVVCVWPLSGQYGPGSRVLYYALIAACVFGKNAEWLRNACLAAALLFPAVAAIHGIVLASVHVNGVVDMDIYGAFQLCSIGILAAPVTVKLSRTYFYNPGRNTIFVWTGLVLTGLLSLTIEFFRVKTTACTHDDKGNTISPNAADFPYDAAPLCGLQCAIPGPTSPLRGGSTNNIYVIPAPDKLTFNTATLLAAACCIPAVLSLVSMWNKILEINWKNRFRRKDEEPQPDELIDGTNGATVKKMKGVNNLIALFLSAVETPVFGAAVMAILIIGERNFSSRQVHYQTEPIASIGQWAPIVGTALGVLGSLYLLLAADLKAVEEESNSTPSVHHYHCDCASHQSGTRLSTASIHSAAPSATDIPRNSLNDGRGISTELVPTYTRNTIPEAADAGRRKVAKGLSKFANWLSTAAHYQFDDSEFKHGKALDFPEIPGEEHRNVALPQIRKQYNTDTPVIHRQSSRAGSFNSSMSTSGLGIEGSSASPRTGSPSKSPHSPSTSSFPNTMPRRPPPATTFPAERRSGSFEIHNAQSSNSITSNGIGPNPQKRRDTLAVPSPAHHRHPSAPSVSSNSIHPNGQSGRPRSSTAGSNRSIHLT